MLEYRLGRLAGLNIVVRPAAAIGSLILWLVLAGTAIAVLKFSIGTALLISLIAVVLHWASGLIHHLGHALAARTTGYPMSGIRLGGVWGILGTSLYPPEEPALPATIHIRRALGGPLISLCLTLMSGIITLFVTGPFWWLALFLFLDNLLVYTLQIFLPLGFNDGSTLLLWWIRHGASRVS